MIHFVQRTALALAIAASTAFVSAAMPQSYSNGLPFVTENGVGKVTVGASLLTGKYLGDDNYVTYLPMCSPKEGIPSKEEIANCKIGNAFYDRVTPIVSQFSDTELYYCFYRGDELMMATQGEDGMIDEIIVYSPRLQFANGIHTGMTAAELVQRFDARIKYASGPEASTMEFEVPGFPSNVHLYASFDGTSVEPDEDSSIYLSPSQVTNGRLEIIEIQRNYDNE